MTQQRPQLPSASAELPAPATAAVRPSETVFTVLGEHARSRSRAALWTTVMGGVINAAIVWWQYPALSWLAAGFVSTAAYGAWGLFDRAIAERDARAEDGPADSLPEMRGFMAVLGVGAAAWAVFGFLAATLRR